LNTHFVIVAQNPLCSSSFFVGRHEISGAAYSVSAHEWESSGTAAMGAFHPVPLLGFLQENRDSNKSRSGERGSEGSV